MSRQPWLAIDKNGKRYGYVSSAMDSPDMVSALEDQAFMEISQIGGRSYVIFDDNWEENVPKFQQGGCRYPITVHDPSELTHVPEYYHIGSWTDGVRKSLESGVIKSADSIEELADKLSLERDVLTGAVDHWNELCAQGEDTDLTYYPYKSEWLIPISQPPYHGIKIGGMLSVTECGVRVTPGMEVVNTDGKTIPGLYAGFHTAGGQVGDSHAGTCFLSTCGLSWTGGYIAAKTIVAAAR